MQVSWHTAPVWTDTGNRGAKITGSKLMAMTTARCAYSMLCVAAPVCTAAQLHNDCMVQHIGSADVMLHLHGSMHC